MDREEERAAGRRGRGDRRAARRPALAGAAADGDRGAARALADTDAWMAAADEADRARRRIRRPHLRVAIRAAGAYAHLCAGDFDGFERIARRGAGARRRRPDRRRRHRHRQPGRLGADGQGRWCAGARPTSRARRSSSTRRWRSPREDDDPETESWVRSNQAAAALDTRRRRGRRWRWRAATAS